MRLRFKLLTALVIVFLSLPTVIVMVLSFSSDAFLSFPVGGWSFEPYLDLMRSAEIRTGIVRSLLIGLITAALCLVTGVPASLALAAAKKRGRAVLFAFLSLGFATPLIVSAVGILLVYYLLGAYGSLLSVAVALAVVHLPFLLYAVAASIEGLDPQLEEAARTLGARRWQVVALVKIPALAPGIITGTLLVFVLTVTEFVVSMILTTVESATLPVLIFGSLRSGPTPMLAAASAIYIALAFLAVFLISRFRSLQQFLFRSE